MRSIYTTLVYIMYVHSSIAAVDCNEFRRGFFTLVLSFLAVIVIGLNPVTLEVAEGEDAVVNMEILFGSLQKNVVVTLSTVEESAQGISVESKLWPTFFQALLPYRNNYMYCCPKLTNQVVGLEVQCLFVIFYCTLLTDSSLNGN